MHLNIIEVYQNDPEQAMHHYRSNCIYDDCKEEVQVSTYKEGKSFVMALKHLGWLRTTDLTLEVEETRKTIAKQVCRIHRWFDNSWHLTEGETFESYVEKLKALR